MKKNSIYIFFIIIYGVVLCSSQVIAGPSNSTYEIKQYGFGTGGSEGTSNGSVSINAIVGEDGGTNGNNGTQSLGDGLIFTQQTHVPPPPTVTNPSSYYDRLKFVINTGNNPTDTTYAVAISPDNFVTTYYVQNDNTLGTTLGNEDRQLYSTWGGTNGTIVSGLNQDTTYYLKVKAMQGAYTESQYSQNGSATTSVPSLTFQVSSDSISFDNLNSGNSHTDNTKSTTLTTSTNAYNGYIVYGRVINPLTYDTFTIPNYSSTNSSPSTWAGYGFGYSTDDTSLTGGTGNRFTNGGVKYAGFVTTSPGDPVADYSGPISTPLSNDQHIISYQVKTDPSQPAGMYKTSLLYIVVPQF